MSERDLIRRIWTFAIVFGVTFGLHGKEFVESLWRTKSLRAAGSDWVTHQLPEVPVTLLLLVICLAIGFAWERHDIREKQARWEERPDGYQPDRLDD